MPSVNLGVRVGRDFLRQPGGLHMHPDERRSTRFSLHPRLPAGQRHVPENSPPVPYENRLAA